MYFHASKGCYLHPPATNTTVEVVCEGCCLRRLVGCWVSSCVVCQRLSSIPTLADSGDIIFSELVIAIELDVTHPAIVHIPPTWGARHRQAQWGLLNLLPAVFPGCLTVNSSFSQADSCSVTRDAPMSKFWPIPITI